MNLDALPSGNEMNALIANKLFGWKGLTALDAEVAVKHRIMPDYSGDAGAAFEIIKKFGSLGLSIEILVKPSDCRIANYDLDCCMLSGWTWESPFLEAVSDSFPVAVCMFTIDYLKSLESKA